MGRRSFDPCHVTYGGRPARGVRTRCGKCGREEKVHVNVHGAPSVNGESEAIAAIKRFEALGWEIGPTQIKDRCPDCIKAANAAKPKLATKDGANMLNQDKPAEVHAPSPREMTPTDRRIIFAKLEDVYGIDSKGYTGAWTDKTVAEDLGVPRAWVTEVREQFFGPEGGNELLRTQIAEARTVVQEAQNLLDQINGIKDRVAAIQSDVGRLSSAVTPLTNTTEKIERTIIALEKTVR